jgi:hypothetical protein
MSAPFPTYNYPLRNVPGFDDLASVRLREGMVTDDGVEVPAGSEGTVVGVWLAGEAYEVEFSLGLATVEAHQVEAAPPRR